MAMNDLEPNVKVFIRNVNSKDHDAFGGGIATLCRGVREYGSLNAAAKQMHMAYSKAWRIMNSAEKNLGFPMLVRNGAHGSTLTPEAERLLAAYDRLCASLQTSAREEFRNLLS